MILNCIWLEGSKALESVEFSTAITYMFTVIPRRSICYGDIYVLNKTV